MVIELGLYSDYTCHVHEENGTWLAMATWRITWIENWLVTGVSLAMYKLTKMDRDSDSM